MTESNSNFNFTLSSTTRSFAVHIEPIEFYLVFRKKVNMTAVGPNENKIKNVGQDIGKEDYKAVAPVTPLDFPREFRELYKA